MKLIMAIISDEDSNSVISELGSKVLCYKVVFNRRILRSGNTTIMIGADEDKILK